MFNYRLNNPKKYYLVGCYKNGKIYTGSYNKTENKEIITCINTGKEFYSIKSFLNEIYGLEIINELISFLIYDDNSKKWCPLFLEII